MSGGRPFDSTTGRVVALRRWAREPDPIEATRAARRGLLARFEREVDPDGLLDDEERQVRARRLLRAHMLDLAERSRVARAARTAALRQTRS